MSDAWLPEGHLSSWDLHVAHERLPDAGSFTGGGWKLCWHITVSPWLSVDSMVDVLRAKNAAPHVVIGGRVGVEHPVAVQTIPFDRAGRALAHPSGPETNRANTIQVEICAQPGRTLAGTLAPADSSGELDGRDLFAIPGIERTLLASDGHNIDLCMLPEAVLAAFRNGVASWDADTYRALASLACLIEHRVEIKRGQARSFQNTKRFTGAGWVSTKGHLGHMHCPGNDHVDPTTAFRGDKLIHTMGEVDH